eukprot:RCo008076
MRLLSIRRAVYGLRGSCGAFAFPLRQLSTSSGSAGASGPSVNKDWQKTLANSKSGFHSFLVGVEYNKPTNGEHLYGLLNSLVASQKSGPAPVVLMESFNCPIEEDIFSGQVVPYKRVVPVEGTKKAIARLKDPAFRARLSG